jgi:Gas vesicle synthesis protein GvpO
VADLKAVSRGRGARTTRREDRVRLTPAEVARRARRGLAAISGLEAERVTSLEPSDDGSWKVTVELLELSRTPETDDVLGTYEVLVDASGELLGYHRIRRYARGRSIQDREGWR